MGPIRIFRDLVVYVALLAMLLVLGCKKKPEAQLKDAFQAAPPSPQKTLATDAMAAFEKKDYQTAVIDMRSLRSDPTISPDQLTAAQDMYAKMQSQLIDRAAAGDKQAQATLDMMKAMPHR
jgi:hypothetical protein